MSPVEIALAAPFLCLLIAGVTDVVDATFYGVGLQRAADRGARAAATHAGASPGVVRRAAARAAGLPEDRVVVRQWVECSGLPADEPVTACARRESAARYLEVRVSGRYQPQFSYGSLDSTLHQPGASGSIALKGSAVLRTG
ncbi:MAG: hypothetical protein ACM3YM_05630 [Sphingomonadales bacterium]